MSPIPSTNQRRRNRAARHPEAATAATGTNGSAPAEPSRELLQNLIESLREELRQFGEMLMLLEHQQELLRSRQLPDLFPSVAAISAHAESLRAARQEREQRRRDFAARLALPEDTGLHQIVAHLPTDYRPLLEALIRENHELHSRSQQGARDNQAALGRAVEVMHGILDPAFAACPGNQVVAPKPEVPGLATPRSPAGGVPNAHDSMQSKGCETPASE
jgi:hypothetical protein